MYFYVTTAKTKRVNHFSKEQDWGYCEKLNRFLNNNELNKKLTKKEIKELLNDIQITFDKFSYYDTTYEVDYSKY